MRTPRETASPPPRRQRGRPIAWFQSEIGRGRQGVVHALSDGRVAKRYFDHVPDRSIRAEFECARFAHDNGVPTWRPDYVSEDGRSIVGSRLEGAPLSIYASRRPWRIAPLAAELGRIHAGMHQLAVAPDLRAWRVKTALPLAKNAIPGLSKPQIRRANEVLAEASTVAGFCHGDLAPANLRVRNGRPALLDWGKAGVGVPALDVANAYSFLCVMPPRGLGAPLRARIAVRAWAAEAYLAAYAQASGRPRLPSEIWALSKLAREAGCGERSLARDLARGAFLRLRDRVTGQL